jgi:hypothetical protein
VLCLVTGTVRVLMPAAYRCQQPTRELLLRDSIGCLTEADSLQIAYGRVTHEALVQLLGNKTDHQREAQVHLSRWRVAQNLREEGDEWKDEVWLSNGQDVLNEEPRVQLHYQNTYTCSEDEYNEMAMLWLNSGVKSVKVLMQRGFPHMLGWQTLLPFFGSYFLLAAYSSGTSVPAGLIIPHLILGGAGGAALAPCPPHRPHTTRTSPPSWPATRLALRAVSTRRWR